MMACIILLSSNACSDSNMNPTAHPDLKESGEITVKDFGKTIPVGIDKENDTFRVSLMIRAQPFKIKDTKENTVFISMIRQAIRDKFPLHIFIKAGTPEIVRVEKVTEEDLRYFKSALSERAKKETINTLSRVIPNVNLLNSLFAQIKNLSCETSPASPCITFRYPIDGCYARAHKMREILNQAGYECEKQFVYGNLKASTGTCCVAWAFHVAILVSFKNASGVIEKRIIDPSLFSNGPVPDAVWRDACVNSLCGSSSVSSFVNTAGDVYYRDPTGSLFLYDDHLISTNCTLNTYYPLSGCNTYVLNECPVFN